MPRSVRPREKAISTGESIKKLERVASDQEAAPKGRAKRGRAGGRARNGTEPPPKKRQHFDQESAESEADPTTDGESSEYKSKKESASAAMTSSDSEEGDEEDYEDDSKDHRPAKGANSAKGKSSKHFSSNGIAGKELWRPGVKANAEPGEQVFIQLPKAREQGKIPYADNTIHPNTFLFLGDLQKNNDREWLKLHDADYRKSLKDWDSFVGCLTQKVTEKDDTIPDLPAKDLTFRIYRDVRFSQDPTPYKTHFSAAWSRTGRKGPYAAYYLQIKPGGSFVGGGLWCPEAAPLSLLRGDVLTKSHKLKKVLLDASIRKHLLGGIPKDEKKAIKAFIDCNSENMLKTQPRVGQLLGWAR